MKAATIDFIVEEIFGLYEQFGEADYIGEPVSQIEHMSQSAQLAMNEGHSDEIILAAFFHDIGHLCFFTRQVGDMNGLGAKRHEVIGADYIRSKGFPEMIARLIEYHVQAKRYLTYKHPSYYESLSEASKKTLLYQGGLMKEEEALAFEADPLFAYSIRMRQWDELAKETETPLIDMELLKEKARKVLFEHRLSIAS